MKRVFVLALSLILVLPAFIPRGNATTYTAFSFGIAGDMGDIKGNTNARQSLLRLANTTGLDFFVANGDLAYTNQGRDGVSWCNEFKAHFGNVIILAGNHDTGESQPNGELDFNAFVSGCPFPLTGITWHGSGVNCNTDYTVPSCYGREFYFDYKSPNPQVRLIFISPRVANITGAYHQTGCPPTCLGTQRDRWDYVKGDAHYNWLNNTIQGAFSAGIPYVFVIAYKVCVTGGIQQCDMRSEQYFDTVNQKADADLWNLVTGNNNGVRVTMFLGAHDHNYQRSKQMSVRISSSDHGCPGPAEGKHAFNTTQYLTPSTDVGNFTDYSANCITHSASPWIANDGTLEVIQGTFGQGFTNFNDTTNQPHNALETPYFVTAMGANYQPSANRGHGWVKYDFSATGDPTTVSTNFCRDGEKPTSNFASCINPTVYSDSFQISTNGGGCGPSLGNPPC